MRAKGLVKLTSLFLLLASIVQGISAVVKPLTETEKINALLQRVDALKDAVFIRNGSEYDAKTAAKFLRGKWEKQGKDIKTAAEFIEKIASKSSTSGKPYVIRFKDGHAVECGDFLRTELNKLEPSPEAGSPPNSVPEE